MFATVRINTPLETIEPYKSAGGAWPLRGERASAAHGACPLGDATGHEFLAAPERAVVDSGTKKIVYVEREPGLFEGVEVELGPRNGEYYPVLAGLNPGDKIAAAGGFLIDAETRLNPAAASAYFGASGGPQASASAAAPTATSPSKPDSGKAEPAAKGAAAPPTAEELKNIRKLPPEDQKVALAQRVCPITNKPLGAMGVPVKIMLKGQPVFLCCAGCVAKARKDPEGTLKKVAQLKQDAPKGKEDTPKEK